MKRLGILIAALVAVAALAATVERKLPAGVVAGYTFNTGAARDLAGKAGDGTLANGAVITSGALVLDGTNDMVTVPEGTWTDLGGAFTVAAWVEPSSPGSANRTVVSRYVTSGTSRSWAFFWRHDVGGTPFQLAVYSTGASSPAANYLANATLPTSGWHHTVAVWDSAASAGARARFYLDGVEVAVSSVPSDGAYTPFDTGLVTTIGSGGTAASAIAPWSGKIDDVLICRHALTTAEVQALYRLGRSP